METSKILRPELLKLTEFVKQILRDIHRMHPYCIAVGLPGCLARAYRNGRRVIHPVLCRQMLEQGRLQLSHLWTSVDNIDFNVDGSHGIDGGIWSAKVNTGRVSNTVYGQEIQISRSDLLPQVIDERLGVSLAKFSSLAELLVWRSTTNPEGIAYSGLDHEGKDFKTVTFHQFGMKVVDIANFITTQGGFQCGDRVVLLFPNGIEFAATMYAIWMLGLVPVPAVLPESSWLHEDVGMLIALLTELQVSRIIGGSTTEKIMTHKTTVSCINAIVDARPNSVVPTIMNISKAPKIHRSLGSESGYNSPPKSALAKDAPAVIYAHYSTDMRRTLVKLDHTSLLAQCRTYKAQYGLVDGTPLVSCWSTFAGVGLLQSCGFGIYIGAPTILIRYSDFQTSPQILFEVAERHGGEYSGLDSSDRLFITDFFFYC